VKFKPAATLIELAAADGLDKRGDYRLITPAKLASLGDPA